MAAGQFGGRFLHFLFRFSKGKQMGGAFTSAMLSVITGGARSGKSGFAQSLCIQAARVVYVATARAEDQEMAARIRQHRDSRPAHWLTIEEPLEIGSVAECYAANCDFMLLDCLTLWLSNLCWEHRADSQPSIQSAALREVARLAHASAQSHIVVVTNEIGAGMVPETLLARFFRDLHGWVNQEAARSADWVYHMVAGIPVTIKQPGGRP